MGVADWHAPVERPTPHMHIVPDHVRALNIVRYDAEKAARVKDWGAQRTVLGRCVTDLVVTIGRLSGAESPGLKRQLETLTADLQNGGPSRVYALARGLGLICTEGGLEDAELEKVLTSKIVGNNGLPTTLVDAMISGDFDSDPETFANQTRGLFSQATRGIFD